MGDVENTFFFSDVIYIRRRQMSGVKRIRVNTIGLFNIVTKLDIFRRCRFFIGQCSLCLHLYRKTKSVYVVGIIFVSECVFTKLGGLLFVLNIYSVTTYF